jgi:hypothetical protein
MAVLELGPMQLTLKVCERLRTTFRAASNETKEKLSRKEILSRRTLKSLDGLCYEESRWPVHPYQHQLFQ